MTLTESKYNKEIISLDELQQLSQELLKFAGNSKIFAFYGEMGAGKTTFIKAICSYLGVKDNVSSPTFSLVNEYIGNNGNPIYHFDFYRIEKEEEAYQIGYEDYFYSGNHCFIEWPEKIKNLLPAEYIKINIRVDSNKRIFTFTK